jgi:hypothetical protein
MWRFANARLRVSRDVAGQSFMRRNYFSPGPLLVPPSLGLRLGEKRMSRVKDPLAQFGLDAIDLRWTLKDIDSKRSLLINRDHLPKLIELGLVEMRDDAPSLTAAGQAAVWER